MVKFSDFSLINQGLHRNFPGDAILVIGFDELSFDRVLHILSSTDGYTLSPY